MKNMQLNQLGRGTLFAFSCLVMGLGAGVIGEGQAQKPAASARSGSSAEQFGSAAPRSKVAPSNSKVAVTARTDNEVENKKKQKESIREKREGKGGRIRLSEIETVGVEKKLNKALLREIALEEKLLKKIKKGTPQHPDILRRLIENYHQTALLTFFQETRSYDQAWDKWDKSGRQGPEPQLVQRDSRKWTSKVIQTAQQFISEYPKHKKVDEAYFQIAFAMDSLNQARESAKYYSLIVANFPSSPRIADAHFALGEFYFSQQDFKKALTSYSEVMRFSRSPIYPWALYKIAWCHYNNQNFRNALGAFQNVVRLSGEQGVLSEGQKIKLKEEALRDMVLAYAELGDVSGAERYFSEVGGDKYYGDMLLLLASNLEEKGQYDESVSILRRFVARNPSHFKAASVQIRIVDVAGLKADKTLLWKELEILLSRFNDKSPWATQNAKESDLKENLERIQAVAINYPKKMHQLAQKDNNKYFFAQAEIGYNLYLKYFPNGKDSIEVAFLLGEIQYAHNRHREAVFTFDRLIKQPEMTPKHPFYVKVNEYLISSSYVLVEQTMQRIRKQEAKLGGEALPLAPELTQYIKVCNALITRSPKSKGALDCEVDLSEIYLKNNHYVSAEKHLKALATDFAKQKEGEVAAKLLLWMSGNDKKKLLETAQFLDKIPEFNKGDVGSRIGVIKESAQFETISGIEKSGKFEEAAKGFEKFALASPQSKDAPAALMNAGINYRKAGESEKAIGAFTLLYEKYPKSPQAVEAMLIVIDVAEQRLQLDKAASLSLDFITKFPKDKRSATISRETCYLYDALGNVNSAVNVCGKMIQQGGKAAEEGARVLADLYERTNRFKEFGEMVDKNIMRLNIPNRQKMQYLARVIQGDRKMGRNSEVKRHQGELASLQRKYPKEVDDLSLTELARMEYERQLPVLNKFRSVRLTANKKDLSDLLSSIQQKTKVFEELKTNFRSVITVGDSEWAVASLFHIGEAAQLFAKEVRSPPIPPGASPDDVKKLKELLDKQVGKAMIEQAKTALQEAMKVITKFAVYTEFSKKVSDSLAVIAPSEFHRIDDYVPEGLFVGSQVMSVGKMPDVISQLRGGER